MSLKYSHNKTVCFFMIEAIETYLQKTIKCGDDVVSIVSIFLLTIKKYRKRPNDRLGFNNIKQSLI